MFFFSVRLLFALFAFSTVMLYSCSEDSHSQPMLEEKAVDAKLMSQVTTYLASLPTSELTENEGGFTASLTSNCGPGEIGNCVYLNNHVLDVASDRPSFCLVRVTCNITICQDASGDVLISFEPVGFSVLTPPNPSLCQDWIDDVNACITANDVACVDAFLLEMQTDVFEQFEFDFMEDFALQFSTTFPCDGAGNQNLLQSEFIQATCQQICLSGKDFVFLNDCGGGCCVKTKRWCANSAGGVTSAPAQVTEIVSPCTVPNLACTSPWSNCASRECR